MNKRQKLILNSISEIDDATVERNLDKRQLLWNRRKKRPPMKWVISLVAACLCLAVLIPAVNYFLSDRPIYEGMTVSGSAEPQGSTKSLSTVLSRALSFKGHSSALSVRPTALAYTGGLLESALAPTDGTDASESTSETDPPLEVGESDGGKIYYAMKNEDVYIHIHLSNPGNYEILSFTLNGKKYASHMFEPGSNLEELILKYNVGDADGLCDYTIDAIKYVDGEAIKNVQMKGDRVVQVYVNDDSAPLQFNAELVGFELAISPEFDDSFEGEHRLTSLSLWQEDEKLRDLDPSTTLVTGLPTGQRLVLKATYNEGGEERTVAYVFNSRAQSEGLDIKGGLVVGLGSWQDTTEVYIDTPLGTLTDIAATVYLGPNVKNIPSAAFRNDGCRDIIKKVVISEGCESIEKYAFLWCSHLTSITLPSSLETIGDMAFARCVNLSSVILPENVKSLGSAAFFGCTSLEEIYIKNSNMSWSTTINGRFKASLGVSNDWLGTRPSMWTGDDCLNELADFICQKYTFDVYDLDDAISHPTYLKFQQMIESDLKFHFVGCSALESIYFDGSSEEFNASFGTAGLAIFANHGTVTVYCNDTSLSFIDYYYSE